tara:strand:- start:45 stop:1286 length:1242 start_codon:yes stop_codon:yes gene_type:complete
MDLSFNITNSEDIEYLKNVSEENKEKLLQIAISIGLKSIQMSEVNMDCHSYIDPIKTIIENSSEENKSKINMIDDKLDALLHIRTNSSRKGRLSEDLCIRRLTIQYPQWEFIDVTHVGHEGDCRAKTHIGDILYEFKSYDTNVNREQILKFYKDLETTGIKLGIFVSNTSGIVGKKDLEWEIINDDTLVVYISNTGFNGHGCIMATELLLALVDNNILNKENNWLVYQNYDKNDIYQNLLDNLDEYKKINESMYKHKKHISEYRCKTNAMIDNLESEVFYMINNSENTFSKILGLVESIKSEKKLMINFDIDDYLLKNNFTDKMKNNIILFHKLLINLPELNIQTNENELFIFKNDSLIAKTKTLKSKIQLLVLVYPEEFNFNPVYEEFKDNKIIIELNDNYKLWELIKVRLK